MTLNPTKGVIVLKRYEAPTETEGGIVLPQNVSREANSDKIAEVMCVGKDVTLVKPGDKVAWSPYNGVAVNFGQTTGTLFFVKEENILAHIN
jgi:co-chaperonin GroES (HSP10)